MATANTNTPASAGNRYYPNLKDQVPYQVEFDHRQLRSMIYDLLDVKPEIQDTLLTANKLLDASLVAARPVIFITRQDTVGGWTVQWNTNKDGSLKFKGTAVVTPTITANTYSAYVFIAISTTEAMLVAYITGGNLS